MSEANKPNYDVAALPGATLAAVLAAFMPQGPYGYLSAIISITLLSILVAYEKERPRTELQSVALACVVGLCSMLFFGFLLELYFGGGSLEGVLVPCISGRTCSAEHESAVPIEAISLCWLVAAIVMYMLDRQWLQKKF